MSAMLAVGSIQGNSILFLFLNSLLYLFLNCLPFLGARTTSKKIASDVMFLLVVLAPKNGMRARYRTATWGAAARVRVPGRPHHCADASRSRAAAAAAAHNFGRGYRPWAQWSRYSSRPGPSHLTAERGHVRVGESSPKIQTRRGQFFAFLGLGKARPVYELLVRRHAPWAPRGGIPDAGGKWWTGVPSSMLAYPG